MPSPFPGMDPYLERPDLWPGLHSKMINEMQDRLNPRVRPNYLVQIETRVYVFQDEDSLERQLAADINVEQPQRSRKTTSAMTTKAIDEPLFIPCMLDPQVEEPYLEIKDRRTHRLVTVVEVLSPSNKTRGSEGRDNFLSKRRQILASDVHWVEIDLLRGGLPSPTSIIPRSDYRIFASRVDDRRTMRFWPVQLRQKLPVIGIPLTGKDADVPLDLGAVLSSVYERAGYEDPIDYSEPPEPPLKPDDAKWAHKLLRAKKLR